MPSYKFSVYNDDFPGEVTHHSKRVEGEEYTFLPAVIQAFNEFLIGAGYTYLVPTIEQPEHGVYIIRQEKPETQVSMLPSSATEVLSDGNFEVGDSVYVVRDGGYDDRIVTGRVGTLISIDHNNRQSQPYEVAFDGWTGGHHGTSTDKTIKSHFFVTPQSIIHEGEHLVRAA